MSQTMEEYMLYVRNRQAFDPARFEPYAGTWVAFNKEGTEIVLNCAASEAELCDKLSARGLDPLDHPTMYVPGPGDVIERGEFISRGNPAATDAPVTGAERPLSAG